MLTTGGITSPQEILKMLDQVKREDVNALAEKTLSRAAALALVGKGAGRINITEE